MIELGTYNAEHDPMKNHDFVDNTLLWIVVAALIVLLLYAIFFQRRCRTHPFSQHIPNCNYQHHPEALISF